MCSQARNAFAHDLNQKLPTADTRVGHHSSRHWWQYAARPNRGGRDGVQEELDYEIRRHGSVKGSPTTAQRT